MAKINESVKFKKQKLTEKELKQIKKQGPVDKTPKKTDLLNQINEINNRLSQIGGDYDELNKEMDQITDAQIKV